MPTSQICVQFWVSSERRVFQTAVLRVASVDLRSSRLDIAAIRKGFSTNSMTALSSALDSRAYLASCFNNRGIQPFATANAWPVSECCRLGQHWSDERQECTQLIEIATRCRVKMRRHKNVETLSDCGDIEPRGSQIDHLQLAKPAVWKPAAQS